ncbi:hypothetical protein LguiB_027042 [Lonicera macranthoides]
MAPAQLSADIDPNSKMNINPKAEEGVDDFVVNVSEITRNNDIKMPKEEDPDATEYSSSFADTTSGNENCSGLSDAEVESVFYDDHGFTSAFDVFPMRKKKLTNHWRSFIRPLVWRCKWTELRIKELGSRALKYDRDIAAQNRRKSLALEQLTLEGCSSRSFPYNFHSRRKKALKRRKRKRDEDVTDTKSYMSNHNLFSYCENRKSEADGTSNADDFGNPVPTEQKTTGHDDLGINNDHSFLKEEDNFFEQIFRKIEIVHTRVHKLKGQLDIVLTKNVGRLSSSENLSHLVPCEGPTSSVRSPTFSACNGDTVSVGGLYNSAQHNISDYDMGDLVMPESAVSSFGEAMPIPDIIESTVGLLSSADVTQHLSQIGDSSENIVDNIAIHNESTEAAEAERETSKSKQIPPTDKHQEPEKSGEEESTNPALPALESETPAKISASQEQSTLKSCLATEFHFPKNKRKRGERKAGAGGWSRQCPGEPDNR